MPPKVFITGVAGFVGGHVTGRLIEKHSDYEVVGLVRNEEQAKLVKARWPHIDIVTGTLDDAAVLVEQASKADVVIGTLYETLET